MVTVTVVVGGKKAEMTSYLHLFFLGATRAQLLKVAGAAASAAATALRKFC